MYYLCKGCDDCCSGCCKCCEDCCGECCDAISNCFSTPFSFCTFITIFISIIPFILMIVAVVQSSNLVCVQNIQTDLIIQGINNLLNFLFCLYLTFQYGYYGKYQQEGDKTFLEKTYSLILYDWFVCLYVFALIFFIIWVIIGFNAINNEPSISVCRQENGGFLITALYINLICMLVYLIVGFIIFIITVIVYSCDEGSCSCGGLFRCCCLLITCGLCDTGKNDKKNQKEYMDQRRLKQKDSRKSWLHSTKRMCGCLSLSKANPHIDTMNAVSMQDQRAVRQQGGYQQPQYQQQQQKQQAPANDTSFFGQVKGWVQQKLNPPPPKQPPQQQYYQQPQGAQYQYPPQQQAPQFYQQQQGQQIYINQQPQNIPNNNQYQYQQNVHMPPQQQYQQQPNGWGK